MQHRNNPDSITYMERLDSITDSPLETHDIPNEGEPLPKEFLRGDIVGGEDNRVYRVRRSEKETLTEENKQK